ncbi:MAG: multiprotein bridging factor aMBF1 [Methanomassiliicoccales archaeon]|nr:multiprotein bridging factor aMBF1 [Methanomassiliicoccales archaeon]
MICELCGREADRTTPILIEGTALRVCRDCMKFGDVSKTAKKEVATKSAIAERLEQRQRRMRSKDVYVEEETYELVADYPRLIRDARAARDWKQETLAAKLNERTSVINKLERGDIRPDDVLIKKVEKELGIVLREKVPVIKPESKSTGGKELTLGDLMKMKKG